MCDRFKAMADTGKEAGQIGLIAINAAYNKKASVRAIDQQIDKDSADVDANLILMKKIYGEKMLKDMSPSEFYTTYQKFA